jgi:hypothetical protein
MMNPLSPRKGLFLSLAMGAALLAPQTASAAQFTFQPPISSTGQRDLADLDHTMMYTWRIDGVNLAGQTITGASLFIDNIRNWDTNPAQLFMHLLDTAVTSGVGSYQDTTSTSTVINDNFVAGQAGYSTLVGSGVGNRFLAAPTAYFPSPAVNALSATATDYTYTFSATDISVLAAYIAAGQNFALAFDPDCHFFNDGITFTLNTSPTTTAVPEPASLTLLGLGLAGLAERRRRARAVARA